MSYALGQTGSRGTSSIEVGGGARRDVLLSKASLAASRILYRLVHQPTVLRDGFLRRALREYGPGSWESFVEHRKVLLRTRNPNQATYDALRLVIGNHYAQEFAVKLRTAAAVSRDVSVLGAIEMNNDERAVACGVTGGVTLLTGLIGSIYGGQAGATAAGTGGGVAAQTFGCNQEAQQSAERIAAANAQAAQATANAALQAAQSEERAAAEKTKQVKTIAIIGGGVVLLLGVGYAILKV